MPVVIVGGGIGGLSLAVALARRGQKSTVIEQSPAIEAVGAGLQLGPNTTRVLADWGLGGALADRALEPGSAVVRDARTGSERVRNRLGHHARERWGSPYLVLTRSALQSLLRDAAEVSGLVDLQLGGRVVSVRSDAHRAVAVLERGGEVSDEVLFGCDGLRSEIQAALLGRRPARYTGQTVWRGLAAVPTQGEPEVKVWTSPCRHFVRYPVAEGLVNMVAVVERPREADPAEIESWTQPGQGSDLAAAFAGWPAEVGATIAGVERPWRSALYDRAPLARWSFGRITLLGDAAHPMLPFLAQGAAMAIEDAEVAAALLERAFRERSDPAAALLAYDSARRARTAKVQAWSRRNAVLFHLPSPLAGSVFGGAAALDRMRGAEPEARFDWLYGWTP